MKNEKNFSTHANLANESYDVSDYGSESELEQGLALTHEQVSDAYTEGTVDATIEDYQGTGKNKRISRSGF